MGSWGSQLLCKPFFRFFMDQKKTRKPRTFSGGGGGGVGGRRIKLYTDNIKYYCNLKNSVMYIILHSGSVLDIMGLY